MRKLFSLALVALFAFFLLRFTLAQEGQPAPVRQPLAFSHKQHAENGLKCARCHTQAETAEQAGIPTAADCAQCHRQFETDSALLRTLSEYEQSGKAIPWVRVYDLPDFVFFNHQTHLRAKADCATCHGLVETRAALWREKEVSMKACVACHKERGASTACNYCHELNK